MYRRTTRNRRKLILPLALLAILIALIIGALFAFPRIELPALNIGGGGVDAEIASATSDVNGLAHVEAPSGAVDFQVLSGLTGERLAGVRVRIAEIGRMRLIYAEDPSGVHVPAAAPLDGSSTVRRLIMPPKGALDYNITSAFGALDLDRLAKIGAVSEADLRDRLEDGGERAALIYVYNPSRPLALTGASLDLYATPFDNLYVLKPGVDDPDMTALVLVGLNEEAFETWGHIAVDRYLAGRVGQPPVTDLGSDLAFAWAYPVFDVFPPEASLQLGTGDSVTLRVTWRSQNPDPPPPWSFFVTTSDEGRAVMSPESFPLGPDSPSQDVTITVNRAGLPVGDHTVTVFIQPFSEAFGMIQQTVEREITFTVAEAVPTATAGPSLGGLTYSPDAPREGDTLTIHAEGFTVGESVLVEFLGSEQNVIDALPVAQADGSFEYTIDLEPVPAGEYTLRLTGAVSGLSAEETVSVGAGVADAVVTTGELNLRIEPGYDAPVLEILARGDELTVISVNGDDTWYEVVTKTGVQGWVDAQRIQLNIDPAGVPWNPLYPAP